MSVVRVAVNATTAKRAAAIAAFLADPTDPRHGTTNGYSNLRCRCESCRDAWAADIARMRANRRREDAPHGTTGGYENYGCRCRPCTDAISAASLARYHRRRAKAAS